MAVMLSKIRPLIGHIPSKSVLVPYVALAKALAGARKSHHHLMSLVLPVSASRCVCIPLLLSIVFVPLTRAHPWASVWTPPP